MWMLMACVPSEPAPKDDSERGTEQSPPDSGERPEPITYEDVQPVIAESCVNCHHQGGLGGFPLTTYDEVQRMSRLVQSAVVRRTMPPWHADPECNDYRYDPSLSEEQIALISDWVDEGALEGNPVGTSEPRTTSYLSRVDHTLTMDAPWTPPADFEGDEYQCFVLEWPTASKYVTGYEIDPGNKAIVHHSLLYTAKPSEADFYRQLDADTPEPGYPCFGGPGGNELQVSALGGWVPGLETGDLPNQTGVWMEEGSLIILQMHYHINDDHEPDQTSLHIKVDNEVKTPARVAFIADPLWVIADTMDIPAGESVTHQYSYTSNAGGRIHASHLHMHTLGTQARLVIDRADGEQTCLLDIPDWDFDWQRTYVMQEPITVEPGDAISLECQWDNTAANQPLVDGVPQEPQDVGWGDRTSDEMCLGTFLISE